MRQEMMGFGVTVASADHTQTICTSLQTENHTNTSSLNFYRPDALPTNSVKALKDTLQIIKQIDISAWLGNLDNSSKSPITGQVFLGSVAKVK